jgi:diamine N-acetyltransferase
MIQYTGRSGDDDPVATTATAATNDELLTRHVVEKSVQECLTKVNLTSPYFRLRLSTKEEEDTETIMRLVRGLAVYEKELDNVHVTADDYRRDGGSDEPLFYSVLLEDTAEPATHGKPPYCCGMFVLYFGYELGKGRFLYLEDLFLEEAYRKLGGGSLAMKTLAEMSLGLGCQNFYWVALDWNTPALNLYEKIGAKVQEGVVIARYTNEILREFAKSQG